MHERGYFAATDGNLSVRLDCQSILITLFVGTHVTVEKLSAVTLKVASMPTSVRFYRDLLGLEIIYGGEDAYFSSLRTKHGKDPILNLEWGNSVAQWGRLIFYVSDVDRFWAYLKEQGLRPQRPQDASWGERYFHLADPDGHELSFARPI